MSNTQVEEEKKPKAHTYSVSIDGAVEHFETKEEMQLAKDQDNDKQFAFNLGVAGLVIGAILGYLSIEYFDFNEISKGLKLAIIAISSISLSYLMARLSSFIFITFSFVFVFGFIFLIGYLLWQVI